MSQQTSFNAADAEVLLSHLQQFREILYRQWGQVASQYMELNKAWHDQQRDRFYPIYMKLHDTYATSQREVESYIAFLQEQLRINDARKGKLSGLQGF